MGRKNRRDRALWHRQRSTDFFDWKRAPHLSKKQNFYRSSSSQSNSRSPALLNIERKTFYFKRLEDGIKFRISEEGKLYSEIVLELGNLRWCRDALRDASRYHGSTPFFRIWRSSNAVLIFQALSNSKGKFCIISKEPFRGRKSAIFIPEGKNGEGWMSFVNRLEFFIPDFSIQKVERIEKKEEDPVKVDTVSEVEEENELEFPLDLAFDPKKTIIVRRLKVSDDWWMIRQSLEEKFKVMVNLRPCCGNLAVGFCATMQEAIKVCNQTMVVAGDFNIEIQWWDPKFLLDKQKMTFSEGWVEILGIPPQLRTEAIISKIAGICGGLVDVDDIKGLWGLHENIFVKVKGLEDGFIPIGSIITQGGVDFPLRFVRCISPWEEDGISESSAHLSSALACEEDKENTQEDCLESEVNRTGKEENLNVVAVDNFVLAFEDKDQNQMFQLNKADSEAVDSGSVSSLEEQSKMVIQGDGLVDVNPEEHFEESSHYSSDYYSEKSSFVSTPNNSVQSHEDFQLMFASSPLLFAPSDLVSVGDLPQEVSKGMRVCNEIREAISGTIDEAEISRECEVLRASDVDSYLEEEEQPCPGALVTEDGGSEALESSYISSKDSKKVEVFTEDAVRKPDSGCVIVSSENQSHLESVILEKNLLPYLGFLDTDNDRSDIPDFACTSTHGGMSSGGLKNNFSVVNPSVPQLFYSPSFIGNGISIPALFPFSNIPVWSCNSPQVSFPGFPKRLDGALSPSFMSYSDRGECSIGISSFPRDHFDFEHNGHILQFGRSHTIGLLPDVADKGSLGENPETLLLSDRMNLVNQGGSIPVEEDPMKNEWLRVSKVAMALDVEAKFTESESFEIASSSKASNLEIPVTSKGSNAKGMRELKGLFSNVNYENRRIRDQGQGSNRFRC